MHSDRAKQVSVLFPAHNEAESLPNVFEDLSKSCPQGDPIVIDDASADHTVRIAREHRAQDIHALMEPALDERRSYNPNSGHAGSQYCPLEPPKGRA